MSQKGLNVEVYEARNRVGGRIFTVNVGGQVGELGGHNVSDGGSAENLHRLIEEFDLKLHETQVNLQHSYCDGEKLIPTDQFLNSQKFNSEEFRKHFNDLASNSSNMKDLLCHITEENSLLYKSLAVRLAGYEGASLENLSSYYAKTLWHMLLGGTSAARQGTGKAETLVNLLSSELPAPKGDRLPELTT